MTSKVLVIIATGEKEKAITGLMYAKNAAKNNWLDDLKVVFFGPSEKLITEDKEIAEYALEIADLCETMACKYISDKEDISDEIKEKGVKIEYVGSIISDFIKEGYVPMVW